MPGFLHSESARRCLALLSLIALLMVLAASVSPEHSHQGAKQDSCVVCYAGTIAGIQAQSVIQTQPSFETNGTVASIVPGIATDPGLRTSRSRAPPA